MATVQWTVAASGSGLSTAPVGFGITALVVNVTNLGDSRPLQGGTVPRREYIGWIALADNVHAYIGGSDPQYAWRDLFWIGFPIVIYRLPVTAPIGSNQGPDAIQWGLLYGAEATIRGLSE